MPPQIRYTLAIVVTGDQGKATLDALKLKAQRAGLSFNAWALRVLSEWEEKS